MAARRAESRKLVAAIAAELGVRRVFEGAIVAGHRVTHASIVSPPAQDARHTSVKCRIGMRLVQALIQNQ